MNRHEFRRTVIKLKRVHQDRRMLVLALTNLRRQYLASRMPSGHACDYQNASRWAEAVSK